MTRVAVQSDQKMTRGIVSAGTPYAAEAGAIMLRAGGNAADAAVATALALAVTDPANCSFFGRGQFLWRDSEGRVTAVDGATSVPQLVNMRPDNPYAAAGIPGLPQALVELHARYGHLPLHDIAAPAIRLAEEGFAPTPELRAVWQRRAPALALHPSTAVYLGKGGEVPDWFCHPRLAALLHDFVAHGAGVLTAPDRAEALASACRAQGGTWHKEDLIQNDARMGEVITGRFRDCEVTTIGRQGWGHTLIQMLAILDTLPSFGPELSAREARLLVMVIRHALQDRPQHLGTLEPRDEGVALAQLASAVHARRRAAEILEELQAMPDPELATMDLLTAPTVSMDQDTTHASVLDGMGNCVSFTCSIGPHFGQCVADPEHGVLLARSYQMETRPVPRARDVTEMCPTIVTRDGKPVLVLGAAGSERIPGAVMQVIVNAIDRRLPLEKAVTFPRVTIRGTRPRVHRHAGPAVIGALQGWGVKPELAGEGHLNHLGIVHAVGLSPDEDLVGTVDRTWDGAVRSA